MSVGRRSQHSAAVAIMAHRQKENTARRLAQLEEALVAIAQDITDLRSS